MVKSPLRPSVTSRALVGLGVVSLAGFMPALTGAVSPAQQVTVQGSPSPPPASSAPDAKAFTEATRIPDPDRKVEALQKFLRDFPTSARANSAHQAIFDTLVKERPTERERILEHARAIIDAAPEGVRGTAYGRIASRLVEANLMLDEAERFATEGLKVFEQEENRRVQRSRAIQLATLGRIHIKRGRMAEAEQVLKEAYAANPEVPAAVIGLAELTAQKGDDRAALEYWKLAWLTGRLSVEDRLKAEGLYRKVHGSLETFDTALDDLYRGKYPPPLRPEPYVPTPARTTRMVLAEVFTGAACAPCVSVDLGFDAVLERYSRKDVAVLMYHAHIPGPDPLTGRWTDARRTWYGVNGVPNFAVDGELENRGGGGRDAAKTAYDRIVARIDRGLEVEPRAGLALSAALDGGLVRVTATPSNVAAGEGEVRLQIALVEEMLAYSGENGIRFHPMVVRNLAGADNRGFVVDRASPAPVEHVFELAKISADLKAYLDEYEVKGRPTRFAFSRKPVQMDPAKLSVAAFLQEERGRRVLQSAYATLR